MKVLLNTENNLEKASIVTRMEIYIKESLKILNKLEKVYSNGLMDLYMMDNGLIQRNMGMEYIVTLSSLIKVSGIKVKDMVQVCSYLNNQRISTREDGKEIS